MKAVVYRRFGPPDVLRYEDVDKPIAGDDQLLIRVRAASVNPLDWHYVRGTPYIARIAFGLGKPKTAQLGVDVAGQVESVGKRITKFKPGDEIFGGCRGAFAEYACTSESAVVTKPGNVTFEQAAAVPVAGLTALQALRDKGHVQPGQEVLINGAAGGVGTFAVQIAKSFGAEVTGVCSTRNVDMVRSIGADRVVDYTQEDFTRGGQRYDVMLDCVGNHSLSACRRVLNPKGTYVIVGGPGGPWLGPLPAFLNVLVWSRFASETLAVFLTRSSPDDLTTLRDLIAAGTITPVVDKRYRLSEVPEAVRYLEQGHARGKVVITVAGDNGAIT